MEGLRSMPQNRNPSENYPFSALQITIISYFVLQGKDTIPIQSLAKFRDLVQLERITFRAVYLLYKLFFLFLL